MAQVATRGAASELLERLTRPPYSVEVPDSHSSAARPFLALVWELTQRGWAFDVEPGPGEREYLVVERRGEPIATGRTA